MSCGSLAAGREADLEKRTCGRTVLPTRTFRAPRMTQPLDMEVFWFLDRILGLTANAIS
jgi:hypothetical protein